MRTTINLNDRLLRDAKQRAAAEGKTLGQVMEQALRGYLGAAGPRAASGSAGGRNAAGCCRASAWMIGMGCST